MKKTKQKKKVRGWKANLKGVMKIRKLMLESQEHDHKTCNCEGCYWWCMTKIIFKNGRFFEAVPSWKDVDKDEFLREMMRTIQYKMDKNLPIKILAKYLVKRGAEKKTSEKIAKAMLAPIFMVMYGKSPSPLGLLRSI